MLKDSFTPVSRDEFVDIALGIAEEVLDALKKDAKYPVIVSITGHDNAGKSLYWDVFASRLLDKGGIYIHKKSESTESRGRFHETWTGENTILGKSLTLCFCNVRPIDKTGYFEPYASLVRGAYENLGDVIVLTNTPENFIPENTRIIELDIHSLDEIPESGWRRIMTVNRLNLE